MKLKKIIKDIVLEAKEYNTPAALHKEKEMGNKDGKPEDSITDLDLNTLNRNRTIKEYSYGPLNPDDEAAKESRCGNCGAFDQKKATLSKIEKAIGSDGKTVVKNANIGFCEFFWFKCAGARTCDAWVGGGPIK